MLSFRVSLSSLSSRVWTWYLQTRAAIGPARLISVRDSYYAEQSYARRMRREAECQRPGYIGTPPDESESRVRRVPGLFVVQHTPAHSPREFIGYDPPQSVTADDLQPIVRALPFGPDTDSIPPMRGIARARYPHRSEWRDVKPKKSRSFKPRFLVDMNDIVPSEFGPHTLTYGPFPLPIGVDVMSLDHSNRYAYTIVRHAVSGQFPAWSPDRIADLAEDCASDARVRWLEGRTRSLTLRRCIRSVISARVRAITGDAAKHRQQLEVEHASISAVGTDALRAALIRGLTSGAKIADAARQWGESLATGEPLPGKATRCPKGVMAELLALAKTAE